MSTDDGRATARRNILYLAVALVTLVVIFHRLGEAWLGGDDTYYAEIAKEMARTGDLLTPRHGYVPDFHTSKPPMLFWMDAAAGALFGFSSFAMRLPAAVLGWGGAMALLLFGARFVSPFAGCAAAVVLTFTQQYLYHARSAVTDGPFAVFFAFALMAFWVAYAEGRPLAYYAMGFFAGCAVMTRQVPGLFIFAVIAVFLLLARDGRPLKNVHFYGGLILCGMVFLPWHVLMYRIHGAAFLDQYFGVTIRTGITGYPPGYSGNPALNPPYAYASILLSNYWPWFPFLVYGFTRGIRKVAAGEVPPRSLKLFLLCWAFVPLAIFQAAAVKQYHYLTPLYVPFALIVATVFDGFAPAARRGAGRLLAATGVALAAAFLLFPVIPRTLDSREFADTSLLFPAARSLDGECATLPGRFCHYWSSFRFYADVRVVANSEAEIREKIGSEERYYFVLERPQFEALAAATGRPLRVLAASRRSVLFASGQENP